MPSRPDISILLITDRDVLRADFSAGRETRLVELWQRDRPVDASLPVAVELASGQGQKLGRRVLVLTTSAWTQTLAVPASSIGGMNAEELQQTLKFEVESFSGLTALESQLSLAEVNADDGDREFWITQIATAEMTSLHQIVQSRGSRLAGICHPAGLPAALDDEEVFKRLEFWPGAVCCVAGGRGRKVFVSHGDPRSDRWQTSLQSWESRGDGSATTEWLVGPGVAVPFEHLGEATLRLDERSAQDKWLTAWARQAMSDDWSLPVLRPPRKPVAKQTKVLCSVAAAALVFAACLGHWLYLETAKQQITAAIESTQETRKETKELEKQRANYEKERKELQQEFTQLDRQLQVVEPMVAFQRKRLATLLASLARETDQNVVVEAIAADQRGVTVSGLSLVPEAATNLADALNRDMKKMGWEARPPSQEGANRLVNGGPWHFSILLAEVAPPKSTRPYAGGAEATTAGTPELNVIRTRHRGE